MRRGAVIGIGVVLVVATVVLGAVVGVRSLWRAANHAFSSPGCTFQGFSLTNGQTQVAATMVGEVTRLGLPERADLLVLMAAMQESKLTNIPAGQGDRDSVGVLQQRPSQGWGTEAQLADVHYATKAFLTALVKVDAWQTRDPADAIQEVQVSADGSAYAQHQGISQALADALTGRRPGSLYCEFDKPTSAAAPTAVVKALELDLPVNAPSVAGRTITVPGARWQTASWLVANAELYGIEKVSYGGQSWQRSKKWVTDAKAGAAAVVATLQKPS